MVLDEKDSYAPEVRHKYPHMLINDSPVWTRHLQAGPHGYIRVWYDVHVGTPMAVPEGAPGYLLAVAKGVSTKRIDVVAELRDNYLAIEVKPYCNAEAIGQALTYADLLEKERALSKQVVPAIVCDHVDVDLTPYAKKIGVMVFVNKGVD
jgi:hypothetical protein